MDSFFQDLFSPATRRSFQQQFEAAQQQAMEGIDRNPNDIRTPSSRTNLQQLPTVILTVDDWYDPSNRECCICLEPTKLGQSLTRLPCAHLFHPTCIQDWLQSQQQQQQQQQQQYATCPICRYELETTDPEIEKGRKRRMKLRKPRFAKYQLERMSIQELEILAKQLHLHLHLQLKLKMSKPFWKSSMNKNKNNLNNNHKHKHDLIQLIWTSGKIELIAAPIPVEYSYSLEELKKISISKLKASMLDAGVFFDPNDIVEKEDMVRLFLKSGRLKLTEPYLYAPSVGLEGYHNHYDPKPPASLETMGFNDDDDVHDDVDNDTIAHQGPIVETAIHETQELLRSRYSPTALHMFGDVSANMGQSEEIIQSISGSDISDNLPEETEPIVPPPSPHIEFQNMNVADLKRIGRRANVDLSHCIERRDMIEALIDAGTSPIIQSSDLAKWSVSGLRALANEINVDFTSCRDRDDMVQHLVHAAQQRTNVNNYLNTLMPLASLTVPQLRAVAREWQLNIWDCIEKEEMIHRIIATGSNRLYR